MGDPELFASMQLFRNYSKMKPGAHKQKTTSRDVAEMQMRAKQRVQKLLAQTHLIPRELIILGIL